MGIYDFFNNIGADLNGTTLAEFILSNNKEPGEVEFTTSNGETYVLVRRADKHLRLTYPEGDYSGDPVVVEAFNNIDYAPLSVLNDELDDELV
jgi:hypothetical protein